MKLFAFAIFGVLAGMMLEHNPATAQVVISRAYGTWPGRIQYGHGSGIVRVYAGSSRITQYGHSHFGLGYPGAFYGAVPGAFVQPLYPVSGWGVAPIISAPPIVIPYGSFYGNGFGNTGFHSGIIPRSTAAFSSSSVSIRSGVSSNIYDPTLHDQRLSRPIVSHRGSSTLNLQPQNHVPPRHVVQDQMADGNAVPEHLLPQNVVPPRVQADRIPADVVSDFSDVPPPEPQPERAIEMQLRPAAKSDSVSLQVPDDLPPTPTFGEESKAAPDAHPAEAKTASDDVTAEEFTVSPLPQVAGITAADRIRSLRFQTAGDTAFREGDYTGAVAEYRSASETAPGRRAPWLRQTWALISQRRFEEAARSLKTALLMQDDPGSSWISGALLYGDRFPDEATAHDSELWAWLQENPTSPDRLLLAAAFQQLRGYGGVSRELLTTATQIGLQPTLADALRQIVQDLPADVGEAQAPPDPEAVDDPATTASGIRIRGGEVVTPMAQAPEDAVGSDEDQIKAGEVSSAEQDQIREFQSVPRQTLPGRPVPEAPQQAIR